MKALTILRSIFFKTVLTAATLIGNELATAQTTAPVSFEEKAIVTADAPLAHGTILQSDVLRQSVEDQTQVMEMNVGVNQVRFNGGFKLEMMPTGGSGTCAGSTFVREIVSENPFGIEMQMPNGASGTCAGSTFVEEIQTGNIYKIEMTMSTAGSGTCAGSTFGE